MIISVLAVVGLCLGSFVNALVWRLHEQAEQASKTKPDKKYLKHLSITRGRSMCPHCKHELVSTDLVPVLSWLALKGKCRYCSKPVSPQYPLVEVTLAIVFVISYVWWPVAFDGPQKAIFGLWLVLLTGLLALLVYDVRWLLLPNRIVYPLSLIAVVQAVISIASDAQPARALANTVLAVAVGGGLFYLLFQVSKGRWIGGGDVKLGWLLGLIVATPARSLLLIFLASVGGSLVSVPLLMSGRLKRSSIIPFGPFLIIAVVIVQLFGVDILHWYKQTFITY